MHILHEIINKRQNGKKIGIPSYCTASELAIEAILERAKETNTPALIEATANQVNQYGGYTGMKPGDFVNFVYKIADRTGCSKDLIILGGDHLGPLTWCLENEKEAMEKSETLVYEYVKAGFTKIHLDTSMKLADDAADSPLSTEIIARRGAKLYQKCIEAYNELKVANPKALRPVFVIGSEVPIPGGAQEEEEGISVTKPEDFSNTVDTYKKVFAEYNLKEAWNDIIAVVVQPGVEFGDGQVFLYNHDEAKMLCGELNKYPEIVFEGHSTDYQSAECLKNLVKDGIAILKVGPALTFGLREALFSLNMIEKAMINASEQSYLMEVIEEVMLENPANWEKHYHGNDKDKKLARKYSFSDRSRYYMNSPKVTYAIDKMFDNLSKQEIPLNILHQYMPMQYAKVRDSLMPNEPKALAKAGVISFLEDYEYATLMM